MAQRPDLVTHRRNGGDAAVVFVHGYSGHPETTWGRFPEFLLDDPRLENWDVYSLGYHTSLAPDVLRGLWKANPPLDTLGDLLRTSTETPPLDGYGALAIVAHSMGGLVAQHALLNPAFRERVQHVFLFGTPSGGLKKASIFAFWKRQLRDMGRDGSFIRTLRDRWRNEVGLEPPFFFRPIGGDEDEFVPRESSVDVFPPPAHFVPGDHLSMVKPRDPSSLSVQFVIKGLTDGTAPAGPLESARLAAERGDFREVLRELEPRADELDADALVMLALALERVKRPEDAVRILEKRGEQSGTDVLGTLAGRIKRRWVGQRRDEDARLARRLYERGYELSSAGGDHAQAYYHAINIAFLQLVHGRDPVSASNSARRALDHCEQQRNRLKAERIVDMDALWRAATEGEAHLVLGDTAAALAGYDRALALEPRPWQALSMYWQGRLVAEETKNKEAVEELDVRFGVRQSS